MKKLELKYNFLGVSRLFATVSIVLTALSLVIIMANGFNYGIDFAGGTEIQVKFEQPVKTSDVRGFADKMDLKSASVQSFGEGNEFLIRMDSIEGKNDKETNKMLNELIAKVTSGLETQFTEQKATIRRVDSVGPQVGSELKRNGLLAVFYSLLMILIYIGLRFDYKYAPSAVFCLFHDAIITLGIFSLIGHEVNVQTLAAILTIIGYSLNDTIITFDRIRENVVTLRDYSFYDIVNRSLNDVLSRSILTSFTTMLAVVAMYFLASGVIKDFAFALGIGIIIGTYSSIYVASPLVVLVDKWQQNSRKSVARAATAKI
ncbi:MAG: protein translocase subunit SecF [Bdellovibrionales bacterium]|nr:protein translocase subunit SecF [Bdellovibrionales bacterium]